MEFPASKMVPAAQPPLSEAESKQAVSVAKMSEPINAYKDCFSSYKKG